MPKKLTKFVCIGVEGASTDGRQIERQWLEEMASQYNLNTFAARVNIEHLKSLLPDGAFGAYGTVVALKVQEKEVSGQKKLALYAQIEANEKLISLSQLDQKNYFSMEIHPKFADTGKAYLVGLALTDNPASLGTDALAFSAQKGTLNSRKLNAENLFTEATEGSIEFVEEKTEFFADLKARLTQLFSRQEQSDKGTNAQFANAQEVMGQIVGLCEKQGQALEKADQQITELTQKLEQASTDFSALKQQLSSQPNNQPYRPTVTGGDQVATQF